MLVELSPLNITPSPLNPRKRGLLDGIEDLTESIKAKGVLQPIIVRPFGGQHQVVAGHRRREAALRAKLDAVPCLVREYSDEDVLEVQLTENLERENVHPLDEAEAFAELVRRGRTVQQIADKIGRPQSFVAQRMKLLDLGTKARAALDRGSITLAVALVVARVPASLQDEAVEVIEDSAEFSGGGIQPPTAQKALQIVKERFVLRLSLATFPTDDGALVPAAGPCTTCPKRSGNQVALFGDFEDEDLCLDPACHRKKLDAHWKQLEKHTPPEYAKLLSGDEAKKAIQTSRYYDGSYIELDGMIQGKPVAKIVGKTQLPMTLARDPQTGQHVRLLRRADVQRIHDSKRKTSEPEAPAKEPASTEELKKKAFVAAIRKAVETMVANPRIELRFIVLALCRAAWAEYQKPTLERRGVDVGAGNARHLLMNYAKDLPTGELYGLGMELVVRMAAPGHHDYGAKPEAGDVDLWGLLLKESGVDFAAMQKEELRSLRAKEKTKAARIAKSAKAKPAAPSDKPATAKKPKAAKAARVVSELDLDGTKAGEAAAPKVAAKRGKRKVA